MTRLFDVAPKTRSTASRALVCIDPTVCPACSGPLTTSIVEMGALFIHGGYGADRRSTWSICANRECRWSIERVVEETKPLVRPGRW